MARDSSGTQNQPQYATLGTPADAADLTEIANYAALVGNRKQGSDAARTALTGADLWNGLSFYATDTGHTWVYNGGWLLALQADSGWVTPTLGSSWTSQAGETIQYRKKNGVVYFRGRCSNPSTPTSTIFTLPVGFQPDGYTNNVYPINSDATNATRIIVTAAGAITATSLAAAAIVSLTGVTFIAA